MKTKLRSLFFLILFFASFITYGQDTIRSLVITEWRGDWSQNSYVELTNMGDVELDLSEFTLALWSGGGSSPADIDATKVHRLEGLLPVGESYVIMAICEAYPGNHLRNNEQTDLFVFEDDDETRLFDVGLTAADDSISDGFQDLLKTNRGERGHGLWYHTAIDDSVMVDGVGMVFDADGSPIFEDFKDVAGVTEATETHILVRKFTVKEGNPVWTETRGATPEESEWIPIPFETGWFKMFSGDFTTCGNHADYSLNESSMNAQAGVAMDIDFTNETITLPWGAQRDTIDLTPWQLFDFGNGMAWDYNLTTIREDSAHSICMTGDSLSIFVVGDMLEQINFKINVAAPTNDMNEVFSLRTLGGDGYYNTGQYYFVTQNEAIIDSITDVPFGLRVDSLFAHLEVADGASMSMNWLDGVETADVKIGDQLVVTAANGAQKEYYINVNEYEPSNNAALAAITWPEIPEYLRGGAGWTGDTIPNFLAEGLVYSITVPYGVKSVPAMVALPQNTNAKISVERAVSLAGSLDDRTTIFTVMAEDDSTYKEYKVVFSKEILSDWIQPLHAEPIFSQVLNKTNWSNYYAEIFNPGNQDLDLSHYMLSMGPNGMVPNDLITDDPDFSNRYLKYVPGYKFSDDPAVYEVDKTLKKDLSVDPKVLPNDVWVFGCFTSTVNHRMPALDLVTDFHLSKTIPNIWDMMYDGKTQVSKHNYQKWPLYIFKILNDSVLSGVKAPNDPADFELVDVFGRYPNVEKILYDISPDSEGWSKGLTASRKSNIWKGNPNSGGSFGETVESSEWTDVRHADVYNSETTSLSKWDWCSEGLGIHYIDPITIYKSTVKSIVYLVSDGYANGQTIKGVATGTTVDGMLEGIIKEDENQYLRVSSTADGSEKTGAVELIVNDTLIVTSADSVNSTTYILDVGVPLDDNATLSSTVYTVEITSETGVISGMDYGISIKALLEDITVPTLAILNIIDQNDELVPLMIVAGDTILVETSIHDSIYFEVVAQNGTHIITYKLEPTSAASDAFVLSDIYEIDQDLFFINFIEDNVTVGKFLENIYAVKGATAVVVDKLGFVRMVGFMSYDDEVLVTSMDGTAHNTYYLGFKAELDILGTDAYVVSDVYEVNQVDLIISQVPNSYDVAAFSAGITTAPGATFIVADLAGVEKTSGLMIEGDLLIVTSEDGAKTVSYTVSVTTTGIDGYSVREFNVYPNPTNDNLYVKGIVNGDIIKVLNIVGHELKQIPSNNFNGVISMEEFNSGFYFLNIETEKGKVYTYKIFKN